MTEQSNTGILVINCGSSSLKFSLFDIVTLESRWTGNISPIGSKKGQLEIKNGLHQMLAQLSGAFKDMDAAVKVAIDWLKNIGYADRLSALGHRQVQGGADHMQPAIIGGELLKTLEQYFYLVPNHLPDELKAIKTFQSAFPTIPQVACFDTAFHKDMPAYVQYYPLPEKYKEMGLRKYGFHGLSYQYILQELIAKTPSVTKKKIIIAHLGNGASLAAVQNGISIDTTMGISPVGGLVMGTRSGDLDPGVLLFLLKEGKLTANQLDELLSKSSGLIAIAGICDVQELLKAEPRDPKAAVALTVFLILPKSSLSPCCRYWAAWTCWSLPAALVKTRPASAVEFARTWNF